MMWVFVGGALLGGIPRHLTLARVGLASVALIGTIYLLRLPTRRD